MHKLLSTIAMTVFFAFSIVAQTPSANPPLLIGRVSVNQTHIAFAYAGKIWLVERKGGAARPFDAAATDNNPAFSPDGKMLAFSRFNGNDSDVYVAPVSGGEARRLTFQAEDDLAVAWTPDGRDVIFESTRDEEGVVRFHKVAADGSSTLDEALPLPQAFNGSVSPDGKQIAYNPRYLGGEWRYYRGGTTSPIYIADLRSGAVEKLPNQNFNDRSPMWVGDRIYFASDRTGIYNLFSYDRKTRQTKQLTNFAGQGVRFAAATNDAIVFVQNGRLNLLDPNTGQTRVVDVSVSPDTSALQPRSANALRFLEYILPSPAGDKIVLGTRGEVVVFDAGSGEAKNLTNSSGVAERYPTISPDGKWVAYFSDESGEYALHLRSLESGAVKKMTIESQPSFYWDPVWSPDSKKIAFADRRLNLWLADTTGGAPPQKIDASVYSAQSGWGANFSPDSRFLTYAKRLKNRTGTVYIYDLAQKRSVQVTDGITHTESPVFDANGKYLYFISSPNAGTSEFEWGVLNGVFARSGVVRRVHALILAKASLSPLMPNNQPNAEAKVSETAAQTRIDFDDLQKRFVDLPLPQRDYAQVVAGRPGKIFLSTYDWTETPGAEGGQPRNRSLYGFDLAKLGEMQKIVDKGASFDLTRDGSKLLYRKGRDWFLVSADAPPKPDEGKIDLSKIEFRVNPAEEWRQMFREASRIMRDWFYDPNHHGLNLAQLEREYAAYLPTVTRRGDLNLLIRQMLGSVSVSHLGVGGGDTTSPAGGGGNRTGLLGADYAVENGRVRIKKIYRSTPYYAAGGSFSAPLDQPGVDVREGDYLLEVGGKKVELGKNLFILFENTIGRPTKIMVGSDPSGAGARTYTVYPAAGENRLRRMVWAEENRRKVEKMSGGRLGYIFIESYGGEGIMNAIRGMTGYGDRQGIIIDQRFNGGGITPDFLVEWMQRKPLYYYTFRGGEDIPTPVNPAPPVKVMIINEWNGSAAETGAFMFKLGKVGNLVGKRTIGGGIGPYFFTPRLVDGGQIQLPNRAAYNPDGSNWGIENVGVTPDFDVEITPQDLMAGRDPQLEKAVEVALTQINKTKLPLPRRPAFPIHPAEKSANVNTPTVLPLPGSAFPVVQAKNELPTVAKIVESGKFAAYAGEYNSPMGVLIIKQEGEKLTGDTGASGGRVEFVPEKEADKFIVQPVGAAVTFIRNAAGKITGIKILMPGGREVSANKIK